MRLWKSRNKRPAYSRLVAQASEHDVVHAAEEIVGTAWMAALREAEGQAARARRVCTHMRDTAYDIYHSAKAGRDCERLSESYRELTDSEQALDRIRDRHESVRQFAERERATWVEAERARALEVLADRDRLAEAAGTAGTAGTAEDAARDRKTRDRKADEGGGGPQSGAHRDS